MNYYNENDPYAAEWLRQLMADGLIPNGVVDERSIADVKPTDLEGFIQCHFFAGIGGWAEALRLAGWPEDRPVWTGSCPCQPFSVAGKRKGTGDKRHLWPEFHRLISECRPSIVLGEQVASKDGRQWLSGVFADLESVGYAVAGADMCAAGVGAPHIRQRLYWVGIYDSDGLQPRDSASTTARHENTAHTADSSCGLSDCQSHGRRERDKEKRGRIPGNDTPEEWTRPECDSADGRISDSDEQRLEGRNGQCLPEREGQHSPWADSAFVCDSKGKMRRIPAESVFQRVVDGIPETVVIGGAENGFPLAEKVQGAKHLLKGYGNAIVPQVAAEFIMAAM